MRRLRIRKDGSVPIPSEVMESLEWYPGSYLKVEVDGKRVVLEKIAYDPFAEAKKKPDPGAFDRIMRKQKESARKAEADFEEMMRNPPEVRPEDRPDFWD